MTPVDAIRTRKRIFVEREAASGATTRLAEAHRPTRSASMSGRAARSSTTRIASSTCRSSGASSPLRSKRATAMPRGGSVIREMAKRKLSFDPSLAPWSGTIAGFGRVRG